MPAAKFKIIRKCEVCGEEFYAKTLDSFYCSPRCSKIAYKRRKAEEMQQQRLDEMVKTIPEAREYITVTEAHALFGISRNTVYRLIEKGRVAFFNTGKNQTRLKKDDLMKLYPLRETPLEGNKKLLERNIAWNRKTVIPSGILAKSISWMKVRSINISVNTPFLLDK